MTLGNPLRIVRLGSVGLALIVGAAACGGSGSGGDIEEVSSPFEDFFGFDGDFDSEQQEQFINEQWEAEERIAVCMKAQGFEYTAVDYSAEIRSSLTNEDGLESGTRQYVEKYGFGVSTQAFPQDDVGSELVGYTWGNADEFSDPNEAYLETMSEEEVDNYQSVLWGQSPEVDADAELDVAEENNEPSGCGPESYALMNFDGGTGLADLFEELEDEFDDIEERFEADPLVAQARADIKACGLEAGYEYEEATIYQELTERISGIASDIDRASAETDEPLSIGGALDESQRTELGEAQVYEIEYALAMFDCGDELLTGGSRGPIAVLRAEYEQQFLDDNAAQVKPFQDIAG